MSESPQRENEGRPAAEPDSFASCEEGKAGWLAVQTPPDLSGLQLDRRSLRNLSLAAGFAGTVPALFRHSEPHQPCRLITVSLLAFHLYSAQHQLLWLQPARRQQCWRRIPSRSDKLARLVDEWSPGWPKSVAGDELLASGAETRAEKRGRTIPNAEWSTVARGKVLRTMRVTPGGTLLQYLQSPWPEHRINRSKRRKRSWFGVERLNG